MSNEIKIKTSVDNTGTKNGLKETENLVKKSSKEVEKEFKELGKSFGDAFKSLKSGDIGGAFKSIASGLGPVSVGIAAIAGAAVIASKEMNRMVTEGSKIADLAPALGVTAEEYQKLGFMASQSGSSMETLSKSMVKLGKNAYDASTGSKSAQSAFDALGISIRNSNGELKTKEELLKETFLSLSKVKNSTEQTAMAQELLGKSAAELAPIYTSSTAQIEKYFATMKEGVTYTNEMVDAADEAGDNIAILSANFDRMRNETFAPLVTILASVTTWLVKIREDNKENPFGMDPARQDKYNESIARLRTGFGKTNEELQKMGFSTMEIISIHQMYEAELKKSNYQSYLHSESISEVDKGWKSSLSSLLNYGSEFQVVKNQAANFSVVANTKTATAEELAAAKKIADDKAKKLKEEESANKAAREKRLADEKTYIDKIREYTSQNQINLLSSGSKVVGVNANGTGGTIVDKTPEEIKNDQLAIINAKFDAELKNIMVLESEDKKLRLNKFDDAAERYKLEMQRTIELSAKTQELDKETTAKRDDLNKKNIDTAEADRLNAILKRKTSDDFLSGTLDNLLTNIRPESNYKKLQDILEAERKLDKKNRKDIRAVAPDENMEKNFEKIQADYLLNQSKLVQEQLKLSSGPLALIYAKQSAMMREKNETLATIESNMMLNIEEKYEEYKQSIANNPDIIKELERVRADVDPNATIDVFTMTKKQYLDKTKNEISSVLQSTEEILDNEIKGFVKKSEEALTKSFVPTDLVLRLFGPGGDLGAIREDFSKTIGIAMDLWASYDALRQARVDKELAENEKKRRVELDGMILTNRARVREEKKLQAELDAARNKAKEDAKPLKKAQVGMNTAAGLSSMWLSILEDPTAPFWSMKVGLGVAGSAMMMANMSAQMAMIDKYETGGIVPGNSFTGDNRLARVNSGEIIANAQQTKAVWDMMNGKGNSNNTPNQIIINGNITQDHLQELEDMLYKLNSKSRLSFIGGR